LLATAGVTAGGWPSSIANQSSSTTSSSMLPARHVAIYLKDWSAGQLDKNHCCLSKSYSKQKNQYRTLRQDPTSNITTK
jgi:hypothetical protein